MSKTVSDYIDWEGLQRSDDDWCRVHIYFTASGYVPYSPATWTEPAEGDVWEDVVFVRAEIDPRDMQCSPLTESEIAAARAYLESPDGSAYAQRIANRQVELERAS